MMVTMFSNWKSHDISPESTYTRITREKGQIWLFGGGFGTNHSFMMSQERLASHVVVCQSRTNLGKKVEQFEISRYLR